jgi:hypothetical protein
MHFKHALCFEVSCLRPRSKQGCGVVESVWLVQERILCELVRLLHPCAVWGQPAP